jgi:predicted dehydrogenase
MTTVLQPTPEAAELLEPPVPSRPVRVGLVGLGHRGFVHLAVLSAIPQCEIVGVADRRTAARTALRGVGFALPAFDRVDRMLARAKPDVVVVASPEHERAAMARIALDAGVGVLADAPIASTLDEVEELSMIARERGVPFAAAHALGFHPVFARARAAILEGAIGQAKRVRCSTYVSRVFDAARQKLIAPPTSPGGVLAHDALDSLFYLVECFGTPRAVRATLQSMYGDQEDEAKASLTMPQGTDVGLEASWSVPGYAERSTVLEVEGDNGRLLASEDALELDLSSPVGDYRGGHMRLGHADLPQLARFDLGGESPYLIDASFLAWATGGPPAVHRIEQAMVAHRVLESLYASARAGGSPVLVAP